MAVSLGEAVIAISADGTQFRKGLGDELGTKSGPVAEKAGKTIGDRLGTALKASAKATAVAVGALLTTSLVKGWGRLTAIEEAQAKLKGLGHDASSVESIMKNALASVKGTAFGLDAAATTAAGAVAAGIKPGKDLERVLKSVANSAAAAGVDMNEMGGIFNKVASVGKAQNDALSQVADRGIPIYAALADQLGVTAEEVFKMASQGKIDFEMFESAMTQAAGTVADELGRTTTGSIANFWAALSRGGAAFLGGVFPEIGPAIQELTGIIDNATPAAETWGTKVADAFTLVSDSMKLLITEEFQDGMFLGMIEGDSKYVNILLGIRDAVDWVIDSIALLVTGEFQDGMFNGMLEEDSLYVGVLQTLRETVLDLWETFKDTFANIIEIGKNLGETFGGLVPILRVVFGGSIVSALGLLSLLGVSLETVAGWVESLTGWLADHEGVVLAVVGAYGVYKAIMTAVTIATTIWKGVQAALNLVMNANPILRIVAIIGVLVVAVITAYRESETFRNIVHGAWEGIKTAVFTVWDFLKGVFDAFKEAFQAVGEAASWLWENAIKPAWDAISGAAKILIQVILTVLIAPLLIAWNAVSAGIAFAWESVLKPAWEAVSAAALWLWENALKPAFEFIGKAWSALIDGIAWLWNSVLKPAWDAIASAATWLWENALKPAFDFIKVGWDSLLFGIKLVWESILKPVFDALGAAAKWVWDNVLKPVFNAISKAWDGLASGFKWVYDTLIKPVFNAFVDAANWIATVFDSATGAIGDAWSKVKGFISAPVKWVVETVWDNGILAAWDWIGKKLWGKEPEAKFGSRLGFADGGIMPGYTPGRDVHKFYSPTGGLLELSGGEAIMRPEFTKALGPSGISALNRAARSGNLTALRKLLANGDPPNLLARSNTSPGKTRNMTQSFASGGVWEVPKVVRPFLPDWLEDKLTSWVNSPHLPIIGGAVTSSLKKLWEAAKAKITEFATVFGLDNPEVIAANIAALGAEGPKFKKGLEWAQTQHGKRYQWGGSGNPSWDCSGFMGAITRVIRGQSPGRIGTTASFPWPGFRTGSGNKGFIIGNTKNAGNGIGHMAGTLLGVPVESGSSRGVTVGRGRGAYQSMFNLRAALMDNGGMIGLGKTLVENRTGRPEAVLTPQQTQNLREMVSGARYGDINVTLSLDDLEKIKTIEDFLGMLDRARTTKRQTERSGTVAY